jgi:hypothetical protein
MGGRYGAGLMAGVLAGVILGGCGSELSFTMPNRGSSVSGTITWQGTPLLQRDISFIPPTSSKDAANRDDPGAGAVVRLDIRQGRYELLNPPGMTAGSYKAEIPSKNIPAEVLARGPDTGAGNPAFHG